MSYFNRSYTQKYCQQCGKIIRKSPYSCKSCNTQLCKKCYKKYLGKCSNCFSKLNSHWIRQYRISSLMIFLIPFIILCIPTPDTTLKVLYMILNFLLFLIVRGIFKRKLKNEKIVLINSPKIEKIGLIDPTENVHQENSKRGKNVLENRSTP